MINTITSKITTLVLMLGIMVFTCFMFLNCAEILLGVDISYVSAINTVHADRVITGADVYSSQAQDDFGQPESLKIPQHNIKLEVLQGSQSTNGWLARSNKAHYLYASTPSNNSEHIVLYTHSNWRTIARPQEIAVGDNIFVETDREWRMMFRVTNHYVITTSAGYVLPPTDEQVLVFFIEDTTSGKLHVIQSEFLDVQSLTF